MPDHSTPIAVKTHTDAPVPFLMWGESFTGNGAEKFTDNEAKNTGFFIEDGYNIMNRLVQTG
jgi:2,3-bisphosphoglycerate-independent phosphoglycerate mutase